MGKPKKIKAATVDTGYNWGEFGSASQGGVNFNPTTTANIQTTQSGISQYLNELINPSYENESFRARQSLLDQSNDQYARQLAAQAIERGARGSATQNILNSIAANRSNQMRQAMTEEDARVQNILSALSGIEGNYFNQGNIMANNILQRVMGNQNAQTQANIANTNSYNSWSSNLLGGGASILGSVLGALARNSFNKEGTDGGYGSGSIY
jgi:hypothetical protein